MPAPFPVVLRPSLWFFNLPFSSSTSTPIAFAFDVRSSASSQAFSDSTAASAAASSLKIASTT